MQAKNVVKGSGLCRQGLYIVAISLLWAVGSFGRFLTDPALPRQI